MEDYDGFLNHLTTIQKTKILPLRWIGNICGEFASNHLVKVLHYDDHDDHGFVYRYHGFIWKYLNKPYTWWGTYYIVDMEAWRGSTDSESLDS